MRVREKVWMGSEAVCGVSTQGSLASFDPDTSLWKTSQFSLEGESTVFSGTWPSSGLMRNGKLYSRPTLGCLTVENASCLLPTPTRSFGVNARGWGLSQTGRARYSEQTEASAKRFGYRPPIALLEWMMGFPENHTHIELAPSGMPLQSPSPSGSENELLSTPAGSPVEFSELGLSIAGDLAYEEWENLGERLFRFQKSWQWWVGDWINYGEAKWGETYKAALDITGKSFSSLASVASVCREFETCRRRQHLTFKHHAEVQSLDPDQQDELLDKAATEGLPTRKLRELVAAAKPVEAELPATLVETEEPEESVAESDRLDDFDHPAVEAFKAADYRMNTLREIVGTLSHAERVVLMGWLQEDFQ